MAKKKWYKQKTAWTAIGSILTGAGLIYAGETQEGLMLVATGFQALFLRQAVNTDK